MRRALTFTAIFALWVLPLIRSIEFFRKTWGVFTEDGSINAWNDYAFSRVILVCYIINLIVGVFLTWLFFRTRCDLLALPLSASFLIAIYIVLLQPESVIVLLPSPFPVLSAGCSIIASLVAVVTLWFHRRKRRDDCESHDAA
jgi:hypothetical protein